MDLLVVGPSVERISGPSLPIILGRGHPTIWCRGNLELSELFWCNGNHEIAGRFLALVSVFPRWLSGQLLLLRRRSTHARGPTHSPGAGTPKSVRRTLTHGGGALTGRFAALVAKRGGRSISGGGAFTAGPRCTPVADAPRGGGAFTGVSRYLPVPHAVLGGGAVATAGARSRACTCVAVVAAAFSGSVSSVQTNVLPTTLNFCSRACTRWSNCSIPHTSRKCWQTSCRISAITDRTCFSTSNWILPAILAAISWQNKSIARASREGKTK